MIAELTFTARADLSQEQLRRIGAGDDATLSKVLYQIADAHAVRGAPIATAVNKLDRRTHFPWGVVALASTAAFLFLCGALFGVALARAS